MGSPYTDPVPETRDKRRRSDLDLFVLALIESGLATAYDLQIGAGLSPGATIPALRRLVSGGWASPAKPGPRGRTEHRITAAGRRHLQSSWRQLIEEGASGDVDADLRVALLALFVGGDRRLAVEFLRGSAKEKKAWLKGAHPPEEVADRPPLAYWYQKLRSDLAISVVRAEAAGILVTARNLPAEGKSSRRSK
jgi:DNA-binding PadR family transcriptional regulator